MKPALHEFEIPHPALIKIFSLLDLKPQDHSFKTLVSLAQHYLLRPKGTERWHIDHSAFKDKEAQLLPLLEELNFINEVPPLPGHYDYLLIFGFVTIDIEHHLNYIAQFIEQGAISCAHSVILTSKLTLDPALGLAYATEEELMAAHYEKSRLAGRPVQFITVPYASPNRPTTTDTVEAWLKTQPQPGTCLALSGQPFIRRQEKILCKLLPHNFTVTPSGPASQDLSLGIYLDELARALYEDLNS